MARHDDGDSMIRSWHKAAVISVLCVLFAVALLACGSEPKWPKTVAAQYRGYMDANVYVEPYCWADSRAEPAGCYPTKGAREYSRPEDLPKGSGGKFRVCQTDELSNRIAWKGSDNPTESDYDAWLKANKDKLRRVLPAITKTCAGRAKGFSG